MLLARTNEPNARLERHFGSMNIEDLIESNPSPPGHRRPSQLSPPSQQSPLSQPGQPPSEEFPTSSRPSSIQSNPINFPVLPSPIAPHSHAHEGHHKHYNPLYPVRPEQPDQSIQKWNQPPLLPHSSPYSQYPGYQHPSHQGSERSPGRAATALPQPSRRPRSLDDNVTIQPGKKKHHQKWDSDENNLVIQLRGQGMKWADISKRIPGRTELACRLHYQNYLEKRGEWDDEKKDKLARVYERLKADLWGPVAAELNMPWRAAEAMHWMMGPIEMSRRANTIPFSLVAASVASLPGDSNGRIAQSNRMQSATVCYEARGLADVQRRESTSGPTSTFVNPVGQIRGGSVGGGGYGGGYGEFDADEEDDAVISGGEGEMLGRQGDPGEEGGRVLPSLAEFEGGVPAWSGPERLTRRSSGTHEDWGGDRKRRRSE